MDFRSDLSVSNSIIKKAQSFPGVLAGIADAETLKQVWLLRRMMALVTSSGSESHEATERILERMRKTASNAEFLAQLSKEM